MESFGPTLRASYSYGSVGLILGSYAGSVLFALLIAFDDGITLKSALLAPFSGLVIGLFALGSGLLPAVIICIPAYALLRYKNRASYLTAAAVGLTPGIALAIFSQWSLAQLFAGYGVLTGLLTHHVARTAAAMAVRANNSFKPTPLRGVGKAS